MTDNPAAILRQAAGKLRDAAQAATDHAGDSQWGFRPRPGAGDLPVTNGTLITASSGKRLLHGGGGNNGRLPYASMAVPVGEYAALMDPAAGLALADWLDREAALWEALETAKAELHPKGFKLTWGLSTHTEALAVARRILGEVTG